LISPLTWDAGPRPYKHKFAAQFVCFGGALKKLQCRATDNKGLGLLTTTRFKHFAIAQYARFAGVHFIPGSLLRWGAQQRGDKPYHAPWRSSSDTLDIEYQ
jgi:hypothetical protein